MEPELAPLVIPSPEQVVNRSRKVIVIFCGVFVTGGRKTACCDPWQIKNVLAVARAAPIVTDNPRAMRIASVPALIFLLMTLTPFAQGSREKDQVPSTRPETA
jgi:hypothetical protein